MANIKFHITGYSNKAFPLNRSTTSSTTTTTASSSSSSSSNTDLLCKVKYLNNLPDIPFDPKFIAYPFDPNRFIKYNSTTLEKNFKWDILNEQDMGVKIDLINPNTYRVETNGVLDEADEKLLEEETVTPADVKRSEQHNKSVAWLRRNEYISSENTRFAPEVYDQAESKVGYSLKRKLSQFEFYKDRDSQIKAIEKSFEMAKQPIEKHFSKQGVFPVQELPIFPDFELWRHSCAQVIFDTDPSPKQNADRSTQIEEMSQAMIRGMIDESGEQFVAYFVPQEETIEKRKRDEQQGVEYDADDEYHYKLIREYTWSLKTKVNSGYEENYYFIMKDDGVYYNQLDTRVRLSKRRNKTGKTANSRLLVKHREFNDAELRQQRLRLRELEAFNEEEEEVVEGEGVEEEQEDENDTEQPEEVNEDTNEEANNESNEGDEEEEEDEDNGEEEDDEEEDVEED